MADIDKLIGFMAIMQVPFMNDPDALAYIEEVKTVLKQAKAQEPGWISVNDRLPEEDVDVLVYNGNYQQIAAYTTNPTKYWYTISGSTISPTNWMPLPSTEGLNGT